MIKNLVIYSVLFIVSYNLKDFIKNLKKKDENKIEKNCDDSKNDSKNETALVIYKPKKVSNYNLKDIYNNFFNKIPHKIDKNIDTNYIEKFSPVTKNKIILSEIKDDIVLDESNNFLIYNFESLKDKFYKIKCNIAINNIKNIKLVITDNKKKFIYNYLEEDIIYNYSFILNHCYFNEDSPIYIYIFFYDDYIKINNISMEIIENNIDKISDAIIIFNINDKYIPLFMNGSNILDYEEYDNSSLFFM